MRREVVAPYAHGGPDEHRVISDIGWGEASEEAVSRDVEQELRRFGARTRVHRDGREMSAAPRMHLTLCCIKV